MLMKTKALLRLLQLPWLNITKYTFYSTWIPFCSKRPNGRSLVVPMRWPIVSNSCTEAIGLWLFQSSSTTFKSLVIHHLQLLEISLLWGEVMSRSG
nr:hypothetical protein CFP56_60329 [Quercus suber]